MGEPVNVTICEIMGEGDCFDIPVDAVFYAKTDKEGAMLTQNLVSGHQFNPNELAYDVV